MRALNIKFEDKIGTISQIETKFIVFPSGPGLSTIDRDVSYLRALQAADIAFTDSGIMVILLRILLGRRLSKISGPTFLNWFLESKELKNNNVLFSIDPSENSSRSNRLYLNNIGINITNEYQYVAPKYDNSIIDIKLVDILNNIHSKPKYILINIGGGVQEKLGLYLKNNLNFNATIICTGAAIAFLTGDQAKLPKWMDKFYLGWINRVFHDPKQFLKRYFKAIRIIWVFYQNRKCLDCLNSRSFDSKINGQCIGALGCMNIDSKTLAAKSIESKK